MSSTRQLAAILFTDIAGYTAMMQENETAALAVVRHYMSVLDEVVARHGGTILNNYGDGHLCTFTSATEAVRCAIELQQSLQAEPKVPLRVGLHVGEVIFEDGKPFGDGVNVASRIQSLGLANSILFSAEIHSKINNQSEFKTISLGSFHFKNLSAPMEVFALANEGLMVPQQESMEGKLEPKGRSQKEASKSVQSIKLVSGSTPKTYKPALLNWKSASLLGILLMIIAYFLFQQQGTKQKESIAVLAFADMSPNHDLEYLGDGFSEELIHKLQDVPGLLVTARTSSFYFKGKQEDVRAIGTKLGVNYLLEGSVRQDGDTIRVTAQLINASDGNHIWSGTYDRTMKGILNAQDDIAEAVVAQLRMKVLNLVKSGPLTNTEAYNYYLKGKYFAQHISDSTLEKAVAMFKKAVEIDSSNATYWAALTQTYRLQHLNFMKPGASERALQAYSRASALDSNLSEVVSARAWIKLSDIDWKGANVDFKRAVTMNPQNTDALFGRAFLASALGRRDESIKLLEQAIQADPLETNPYVLNGDNHMREGRFEEAEGYWKKATELSPHATNGAQFLMGTSKMLQGKLDQAIIEASKETREDWKPYGLVQVYFAAGQLQKSDSIFKTCYAYYAKVSPYLIGEVYAFRGQPDSAFFWLDKAVQINDFSFVFMNGSPFLKKIEKDPRYKRIVDKIFGDAVYTP